MRFLDHTQCRTTVGRTPLDEWSARRRDLYLTTHNTHNRQTSMSTSWIRTHNLSKRAAADPRLRPRLHWNQNRHNKANQNLSGHTSPADTCGYIYSEMSVQTYSYCSSHESIATTLKSYAHCSTYLARLSAWNKRTLFAPDSRPLLGGNIPVVSVSV